MAEDSDWRELKDYFRGTALSLEFLAFFVGGKIGKGVSRSVFEYRPCSSSHVVKIEMGAHSFQNAMEWEAWDVLRNTPFAKRWLAPCTQISECGSFLVQERTFPVGDNFKWPKKIPKVLVDRKRQNFGLLNGKLLCHDYGTLVFALLQDSGRAQKQLTSSKWWDGQ